VDFGFAKVFLYQAVCNRLPAGVGKSMRQSIVKHFVMDFPDATAFSQEGIMG
jgi:hypothetical protein